MKLEVKNAKLTQRQIRNRLYKLASQNPGCEAKCEYHTDGTVTISVERCEFTVQS